MAVQNPTLPLVIPKSRTNLVGKAKTFTLQFDIKKQGLSDIQTWLRGIYQGEVEEQKRLGNPPTITTVDNNTGKSPITAERKIVAVFGVTLPKAAMALVERELAAAIRRSTTTHTGKLSNVAGNWQWLHLTADGKVEVVTTDKVLAFGPGDALILRPAPGAITDKSGRQYVWMVNTWVSSGFSGRTAKTGIEYGPGENRQLMSTDGLLGKRAKATKKPRKRQPQRVGFMLAAVQNLRRKGEFKNFHIKVSFGRWDHTAGNRLGLTPSIVIRPRVSTRRG